MWPFNKKKKLINTEIVADYPTKGLILSDAIEVKTEEIQPVKESKYEGWDIEYMPISNRYYPRYKGKYLYFWVYGAISLNDSPTGCEYRESEESALRLIDIYLERKGITSKIIKL